MSAEIVTIVLSAVGLLLTSGAMMLAGFRWCVTRIDALDKGLSTRIDAVDEKLSARIDAIDEKLSARIDAVAADVTELKVAVARLEGPVRHLIVPAR